MAAQVSYVAQGVRVPKTGELIATHLRRRIVRGELREGDTLPAESALMEQFDVSRPTLREAFRILEAEALIEIRRGSRGARVKAPDVAVAARSIGAMLQFRQATLADVYETRAIIEPAAAGLFAQRRTKQDLLDLTAIVDDLDARAEDTIGDPAAAREFLESTQALSHMIVAGARNEALAVGVDVLGDIIDTHLSLALRRSADQPPEQSRRNFRRYLRSCRRLIELIEARDGAGASAHWQLHMTAARQALLPEGIGDRAVLDLFE